MKQSVDHGRILFLDYLRAVACLLVVFGHIYLIGLNGQKEIAPWVPSVKQLIFGPDAAQRSIFSIPILFVGIKTGINVGALGVSIFFLISGFVILRAVERESSEEFVIRRFFRIYPVNAVAVCLTALVTAYYCSLTNSVSPHTPGSIISSIFVTNGFVHEFPTVPVLWSLEVELFFYALMALLAYGGRLGFNALMALSLSCALFTVVANSAIVSRIFPPGVTATFVHISFDTNQITFLLVGAMLYRFSTDGRLFQGAAYVVASFLLFLATRWAYLVEHGNSGGVDLPNGVTALVLFVFALWSGMGWRWIKPLKWIADISYPLYLVHIPLAWISLAWLASLGWGMLSASIASGLMVLTVAWLIHATVEIRAQKFGGVVAKMFRAKFRTAERTRDRGAASQNTVSNEESFVREVGHGVENLQKVTP